MRVYHLLSAEWGLSNLALRRMKVSRLHELNDPFELLAVNLAKRKDDRKSFREWKLEFSKSTGLLCFSKKWSNPVLWSHYASRHYGMCLGFDLSDSFTKDVNYSPERLLAQLDDAGRISVGHEFVESMLHTKYAHWSYEEETRTFVDLDPATEESGRYFFPFGSDLVLREVILGPLCEIPIDSVRTLVDRTYESVYVMKSRLAFQTFTVVEDRSARRETPPNQPLHPDARG